MSSGGKSRRLRERLKLALPVHVTGRDAADAEWEEVRRLADVSPFGARFTLSRGGISCRLLHLKLVMPCHLRCYDHFEPRYKICGLVRRGRTPAPSVHAARRYSVGVAFTGKAAPPGYLKNPLTIYEPDLSEAPEGLCDVVEQSGGVRRPHLELVDRQRQLEVME